MKNQLIRIQGGRPLVGRIRMPPDLEVAQRALFFAALGDGRSELRGLPLPSALTSTLDVLRALGVGIDLSQVDLVVVNGVGLGGLQMPHGALDCGSAWTSLALTAGVLSAQRFGTRISVDAPLATRSVEHLIGPLRARGAQIAGRSGSDGHALHPPLSVAPLVDDESLRALDCALPRSDPAAKSGILFSALFASGPTTLAEPFVSADHTERLMVALGLPLRRIGSVLAFDPTGWDRRMPALPSTDMPGCTTIASCLCAAAQQIAGSALALEHVGINPSRSGVLDMLRSWGADVAVTPVGDAALREPVGSIELRRRGLRGGVLGGEELVRARAEIAALALLGHGAVRGCQLFDLDAVAAPSDPSWSELVHLLRVFHVPVEVASDCLRIGAAASRGSGAPTAAPNPSARTRSYDARADPQLALAAATLALATPGESVLEHALEPLERAYPGFLHAAKALDAEIEIA